VAVFLLLDFLIKEVYLDLRGVRVFDSFKGQSCADVRSTNGKGCGSICPNRPSSLNLSNSSPELFFFYTFSFGKNFLGRILERQNKNNKMKDNSHK
jgi:hypothetical protein